MRILITGATGFIGRHLLSESDRQGFSVRALVRPTSNTDGFPERVELALGDVTKLESLKEAVRDVDAVFHLAAMLKAPWRPDFLSANAGGIENIARACAEDPKPPRLVIVSSLAAGGPVEIGDVRDETMVSVPVSRYGRSKLAGERAARAFADDVSISIVRPPIVFGEGDASSLSLFRLAKRGVAISAGRGPSPVTVIHAADLATALLVTEKAGEHVSRDESGEGLYYATGAAPLEFAEFSEKIGEVMGRRVRRVRTPLAFTWLAAAASEAWGRLTDTPQFLSLDKYREATGGSWACSGSKLRELGFRAEPLEARIEQSIAGYRASGDL